MAKVALKQVFQGWVVGTEPRLAPIQLQALPLLSVLSLSWSVPPVLDSFRYTKPTKNILHYGTLKNKKQKINQHDGTLKKQKQINKTHSPLKLP